MSDLKARCVVFQAHTWKKDLCVNCMKARAIHPKGQGPVATPRSPKNTREGTPDNQRTTPADNMPTQSGMSGDISVSGVSTPKDAKADLEDEINCNKQTTDGTPGDLAVRGSTVQGSAYKKTTQKLPTGGDNRSNVNQNKPVIASKPCPATVKPKLVLEKQKSPTNQNNKASTSTQNDNAFKKLAKAEVVDNTKDKSADDKIKPVTTSGVKPRRRQHSGSRPQAPPPKTPLDKPAAKSQAKKIQDNAESSSIPQDKPRTGKISSVDDKDRTITPHKVHIKGLTNEPTDKDQEQNLPADKEVVVEAEYSQVPSEDNPVALSGSCPCAPPSGGGHYYHKYDLTGSLQRNSKKPVDKRKERVREDLLLGTKKALVTPYTVVDVTNCRRQCEESRPPQLPSTPPPEHPVSEPNSRDNTLKKQRKNVARLDTSSDGGSQGSVHNEPPPSPNLPIILQAEAKRMHAESRTPPPHRKVPIMIRPQNTGISNTYEPIEDYLIEEATVSGSLNEADSMAGLDPATNLEDSTQTDVIFPRQSKARTSNKTQAFETKMAALANLDLLKGIAPKTPPQDIALVEQNITEPSTSALSPNIIEEQTTQKLSKKSGKSFFKKLLKIGSKDAGSEVQDLHETEGSAADVMTLSGYDDDSAAGHLRQGSARDDRVMQNEVQNVLARRQCSAPDICRELTVHDGSATDPTISNSGSTGSRVIQGSEQQNYQSSLMKKKRNMNINVQTVSPPDEEKINNIKQAQEMALSLGIDKLSPRHKAISPTIGEPQPGTSNPPARSMESAKPSAYGTVSQQPPFQGLAEGTYVSHSKTQTDGQSNRTAEISEPVVISSTIETKGSPKLRCTGNEPENSQAPSSATTVAPLVPPPRTKPKPSIILKFQKVVTTETSSDQSQHRERPVDVVVLPELAVDTDNRESSTDVYVSKIRRDSTTSPTSSESSVRSYAQEGEATSPQPTSPTADVPGIHGVRRRSSRSRADMKSGKVARSMLPAPPPPPAGAACPSSPTEASPEHKPGNKRLRHADISAPILTTPDVMSRSCSTADDKVTESHRRMDSISKHSRNKTVSEGIKIDVNLISPDREDAELQFDSLGRRSGRFLNRALPPTPSQEVSIRNKPSGSNNSKTVKSHHRISENEYELVSLDGEAEDRGGPSHSVERPAYEDIDDDDVYSDPVELVKNSSQTDHDADEDQTTQPAASGGSLKRCKSDDYLEPVSGSGEDDKPMPATRVLGKRLTLSRTVRHSQDPHRTVYANTDLSVYEGKPARTVKDGFIKICLRNVETLAVRAEKILYQFVPEQCVTQDELRFSDFSLKSSIPLLQIGDIAFYEARTNKVKPHDCYLMLSRLGISSTVLEASDCGTISPIALFQDRISSDFLTNQARPDHYNLTSPTDTSIAVLGYSTISDLDTAVQNMDSVFTSDLNEYERRVCSWITQITTSILDIATTWPRLQTVSCHHILAVTMPTCCQTFPIVVIPDVVCSRPLMRDKSPPGSQTNWSQLGKGIIQILFSLLRLEYKEKLKDPAMEIPVRSKYSVGLRKFVREILKDQCSSHGIVFGKVVIETMLWGPCRDDMKHLMTSTDHEQAFHIWLELRRHLVINDLAMGCCLNTLDFANMLWFFCSVTAKILMDATRILQQAK